MRLLLTAPRLAARDCRDCQLHVYDEQTGRRQLHAGRPVVRPAGTHPPCRLPHVGCAKGTPDDSHALTPENKQAYQYDRMCRAVGQFPDDPLVRRHALVIRSVEETLIRK